MTIHEIREKDLSILSNLFAIAHLNNNSEEEWTYETALSYLEYYYQHQPDLFLVAYSEDGIPIGAVMSVLKPSFDGNYLTQIELFVAEDIKNKDSKDVMKQLLYNLLELSDAKYNVSQIKMIVPKKDVMKLQNILDVELNSSLVVLQQNFENAIQQLRSHP